MVIVKYALNYFDKIFILVKMINAKNRFKKFQHSLDKEISRAYNNNCKNAQH